MKKLSILFLIFLLPAPFNLFSAAPVQPSDREFLEMVARKTFDYFWKEANPENGLIPDATRNRNCSISVVGFGLASICIADARGWISHKDAYDRVLKTLKCFVDDPGNPTQVQQEHGHHYHWVDLHSGKWIGEEGIFASDTGVFIAGVLTAGEYFKGTEIETLSDEIYKNVDWTWFLNKQNNRVYVGWVPKVGHGGEYAMNEIGLFITLMGIASPTYPIPLESWFNLGSSFYHAKYGDYEYVGDGAAHTHQWSFCFIDPRMKKDYFLDYFQNIREYALASRQWCIDHKSEGYDEYVWGLNVGAGPGKYGDYAAPVIPGSALPYNGKDNDGTVAPTAALGLIPFVPEESITTAKYFHKTFGSRIFHEYGFTDTFNIPKNYWSNEYLGIDEGPIVIMIDNYLYGTVWKSFTNNKFIKKAMDRAGFVGIVDNFDESPHSRPYARWDSDGKIRFDKTDAKSKEGNRSLKIESENLSGKSFYCAPELADFSSYRYLAFWKSGPGDVEVSVEDFEGKKMDLKLLHRGRDGDWELRYYEIPKSGIDLKSIAKVWFKINSEIPAAANYLDFVHLTNKKLFKAPIAPANLTAKAGENGGEIDLSWDLRNLEEDEGEPVTWKLKISESKIDNKRDFEAANLVMTETIPFHAYKKKKLTINDLAPGKKYCIASVLENGVYNTSALAIAEAIANEQRELIFGFDRNELTNFNVSDWNPFASMGDQVRLEKTRGREGNAIALNCNVISPADYHWVGVSKKIHGKFPKKCKISFYVRSREISPNLEFKLVDKDGCVFGKKFENMDFSDWTKIEFDGSELSYWWGGTGNKTIGQVEQVEFAFTTGARGRGTVNINKLALKIGQDSAETLTNKKISR